MGQPAYLKSKGGGENSMSVKRGLSVNASGKAPQDPRDMVKARLPEPQLPVGTCWNPSESVCNRRRGVFSLGSMRRIPPHQGR